MQIPIYTLFLSPDRTCNDRLLGYTTMQIFEVYKDIINMDTKLHGRSWSL